jgi:FkbM family methyltransferase
LTETVIGRAERFRRGSWLERGVDRLRGSRRLAAPPMLRRLHEAVLDRLPGDHLVSVLPSGERVRLSARHRSLSWNPEEYRAFRDAVRPGAIVLDVGANVGAYTLLFSQWTGQSGRVFAFEPSPSAASSLRRPVELNDARNVEVVEAAVSDREGSAALYDEGVAGRSSLLALANHRSTTTVKTMTIDRFCGERSLAPDVVKIDVEGVEVDVLRGARRTLASDAIVAFVEFHPSVWRSRHEDARNLARELEAQGLEPEPLDAQFDVWSTGGVSVRLRRK